MEEINIPSYTAAVKELQADILETHKWLKDFKGCFRGKKVCLVATGPTLNIFQPLDEDVIYFGVNEAFLFEKITFDYIFMQDYAEGLIELHKNYKNKYCQFIYGIHYSSPHFCIPDNIEVKNGSQFCYVEHMLFSNKNEGFTVDIERESLTDFGSCVFDALQIILLAEPDAVYLVGCDCTSAGHCANNNPLPLKGEKFLSEWIKFKKFVERHYSNTQVVSVNPVGLRGVFGDVLQNTNAISAFWSCHEGQYFSALSFAYKAHRDSPSREDFAFLYARLLLEYGSPVEAKKIINAFLNTNLSWSNGYELLSYGAEHDGDIEKAILCLQNAIEYNDNAYDYKYTLWRLFHENNRLSDIQECHSLHNESVSKFIAWRICLLGCKYLRESRLGKAEGAFVKSLGLSQDNLLVRKFLCETYFRMGAFKRLLLFVDETFVISPDWAAGHYWMAKAYHKQGRLDLARTHACRSIKLAPLFMEFRMFLVQILVDKGSFIAAEAILEDVFTIHHNIFLCHVRQAELLVRKRKIVEAIEFISESLTQGSQIAQHQYKIISKLNFKRYDYNGAGLMALLAVTSGVSLYGEFSNLFSKIVLTAR